jgi:hypothetical protein
VDERLADWRQGDCVVGDEWFLHRFDPATPLSPEAKAVASEDTCDTYLCETPVRGFAVLTQTCDLVRASPDRPYVEVAPLVEVDPKILSQVKARRRPRYAYVPGLAAKSLVVDLDRVMTVEKAVIACWERVPGCLLDAERRDFAHALARKRVRVAFPDDFVELINRLTNRIVAKHDAPTEEGEVLRGLREIRVRAAPSWSAPQVELFLWFVRDDTRGESEGAVWSRVLKDWLSLVTPSGRFTVTEGAIVTLDDMTARDYVESDPLDLDRLS